MKPLVNSYIQKLVQTKWDVAVHSRYLLSCETNTAATEEVPAPNQSWRGCNHPTSNWPHLGHQIPYLVPMTANWLSPLWSNTDQWPYAAGVCIVTGMSWWILHSRLVECSLRDNSWDLHSKFLWEAWFFYLIRCNLLTSTSPQTCTIWSNLSNYLENESNCETYLLVKDD